MYTHIVPSSTTHALAVLESQTPNTGPSAHRQQNKRGGNSSTNNSTGGSTLGLPTSAIDVEAHTRKDKVIAHGDLCGLAAKIDAINQFARDESALDDYNRNVRPAVVTRDTDGYPTTLEDWDLTKDIDAFGKLQKHFEEYLPIAQDNWKWVQSIPGTQHAQPPAQQFGNMDRAINLAAKKIDTIIGNTLVSDKLCPPKANSAESISSTATSKASTIGSNELAARFSQHLVQHAQGPQGELNLPNVRVVFSALCEQEATQKLGDTVHKLPIGHPLYTLTSRVIAPLKQAFCDDKEEISRSDIAKLMLHQGDLSNLINLLRPTSRGGPDVSQVHANLDQVMLNLTGLETTTTVKGGKTSRIKQTDIESPAALLKCWDIMATAFSYFTSSSSGYLIRQFELILKKDNVPLTTMINVMRATLLFWKQAAAKPQAMNPELHNPLSGVSIDFLKSCGSDPRRLDEQELLVSVKEVLRDIDAMKVAAAAARMAVEAAEAAATSDGGSTKTSAAAKAKPTARLPSWRNLPQSMKNARRCFTDDNNMQVNWCMQHFRGQHGPYVQERKCTGTCTRTKTTTKVITDNTKDKVVWNCVGCEENGSFRVHSRRK